MAVPVMSPVAIPNVTIISPAHDVVLVGGPIFVHARISMNMHVPGFVVTAAVMAAMVATSVTTAMMTATVMTPVASTFRMGRCNDSNSERCSQRQDKKN